MRYLLFLLVPAFLFPVHVHAVSPSSCDEGTVECYCPEDIDIEDMDFNPLDPEGAEGLCKSLCISMQLEDAYVFSDIDSWALQCKIGGVLTPLGSGSLLVGDAATDALEATADEYLDPPTLGVDIPGFDPTLTESYFSSDGTFETNLLGVYVEAVYSYLISIFAIVAVVIIMAAGVMMMMSRGDGAKVTQAKNMISNALMGIVFLFGAYTIAFFINPELVTFETLKIERIESIFISTEYTSLDVSNPNLNLPTPPSTASDVPATGTNGVTYYTQRGNTTDYSCGTTVETSGCGPTSAAMVYHTLGVSNATPSLVAQNFLSEGFRACDASCNCQGTSYSAFANSTIATENGISGELYSINDKEAIYDQLKDGEIFIVSVGPSIFTSSGHFIVLTGVNSAGNIMINDPNSGITEATKSEVLDPLKFAIRMFK